MSEIMSDSQVKPNARKMITKISIPLFKKMGFHNKSTTWNRSAGEIVEVFDFQMHRYGGDSATRVTVNMGLCSLRIWRLVWGSESPEIFHETDCCPRFRVGYLLAKEKLKYIDRWWNIEDGDESKIREIIDVVVMHCIPYLDRHSDLTQMQEIASRLASKSSNLDKIYLAVLNHILGKTEERDVLFAQLLSGRSESWHARIEEVLKRLSLVDRFEMLIRKNCPTQKPDPL